MQLFFPLRPLSSPSSSQGKHTPPLATSHAVQLRVPTFASASACRTRVAGSKLEAPSTHQVGVAARDTGAASAAGGLGRGFGGSRSTESPALVGEDGDRSSEDSKSRQSQDNDLGSQAGSREGSTGENRRQEGVTGQNKWRGPNSNQLHARIVNAESLHQLVSMLQACGRHIDLYTLAAALSKLPKLHAATTGTRGMRPRHFTSKGKGHEATGDPPSRAAAVADAQQVLRILAQPMVVWLPLMEFRQAGNVLWGLAKLAEVAELRKPCRLLASILLMEIRVRGPGYKEGPPMLAQRAKAAAMYQKTLRQVSAELGGLVDQLPGKESWYRQKDVGDNGKLLLDRPLASSNLMYSLALLGVDPSKDQALFTWCCKAFVSQLQDANSQDLSNMAYAMSLLGLQDDGVWERITCEISRRIASGQGAQFSDQAITNIAWAVLKLGRGHKDLAHNLHNYLVEAASSISSHRELSNLARAAASVGVPKSSPFFATLSTKALRFLPTMDLSNLANLLWAYSSSELVDTQLLSAAKASMLSKPVWKLQRQPMALANILWAFAKLEHFDHQLFQVCMPEVKACVKAMTRTERLMAFWAFSRYHDQMARFERHAGSQLGYRLLVDQELAAMLLDGLRGEIGSFNTQEVGTLASSVCMLAWYDRPALDDLYARALHLTPHLSIPQMSSIMWCLFKMNYPRPELARAMVEHTLQLLHERPPETIEGDVIYVMWGSVLLDISRPEFVKKVLAVMSARLDRLQHSYYGLISQVILHIRTFSEWAPDQKAWLDEPSPQLEKLIQKSLSYYTGKIEDTNISYTQSMVKNELAQVPGVSHLQDEALTDDNMFSIDIVAKYKARAVAIEVDGPFHYMVNRPGIITGDTLWRRKHLVAKGYTVLPVRATEYMDISSSQARVSHLRALLDAAIDDPRFLEKREIQLGNAMTVYDQQPRLGSRGEDAPGRQSRRSTPTPAEAKDEEPQGREAKQRTRKRSKGSGEQESPLEHEQAADALLQASKRLKAVQQQQQQQQQIALLQPPLRQQQQQQQEQEQPQQQPRQRQKRQQQRMQKSAAGGTQQLGAQQAKGREEAQQQEQQQQQQQTAAPLQQLCSLISKLQPAQHPEEQHHKPRPKAERREAKRKQEAAVAGKNQMRQATGKKQPSLVTSSEATGEVSPALQLVLSASLLPPRIGQHGKPISSRLSDRVPTGQYLGPMGLVSPRGRAMARTAAVASEDMPGGRRISRVVKRREQ